MGEDEVVQVERKVVMPKGKSGRQGNLLAAGPSSGMGTTFVHLGVGQVGEEW